MPFPPFSQSNSSTSNSGLSFVEILVVITLISVISVVGYTNLTSMREKQIVSDAAHQLQIALDTARDRSIAVTQDANGKPNQWGVNVDNFNASQPVRLITGTFNIDYSNFDSFDVDDTIPSIKIVTLDKSIKVESPAIDPGAGQIKTFLVDYQKLTGKPFIFKLTPTGKILGDAGGTPPWKTPLYDWSDGTFQFTAKTTHWQQTVTITSVGITELGKLQKVP